MTSREAVAHRLSRISCELYAAVVRLESSLHEAIFDQLVRSTASIGSNWLEAHGRRDTGYAAQFLLFARGSAYEAAFQLTCIDEPELADLAHDASDILDGMLDPDIEQALDDAARFPSRNRLSVTRPDDESDA